MNFLLWHYKLVNKFLFKILGNYIQAAWHFFSIGILAKYLFSPWKRVISKKEGLGFSLDKFFEEITFNLISRVIGFLVRILLITWGFFSIFWLATLGIIVIILWQFLLPFSWPVYLIYKLTTVDQAQKVKQEFLYPGRLFTKLIQMPVCDFMCMRLGIKKSELETLAVNNKNIQDQKVFSVFPSQFTLVDVFFNLAKNWQPLNSFLFEKNIKPEEWGMVSNWFFQNQNNRRKKAKFWEKENLINNPGLGWNFAFGYTPNLDQYALDLTTPTPFFHHLVGREKEVARIEEVLAQKGESNVLLVGEPGVGKKTIVQGFARKVWQGRVRPELIYKRVLALDMDKIIASLDPAGAKTKFSGLIQEAENSGNCILVIDNIEKYASFKVEGMDLTDVITQVIGSDRLQIIAITTPEFFSKYLSLNAKFLKLFEKIEVEAPDKQQALKILMELLVDFEKNKKAKFSYQALLEVIKLSDKLITDIPFPEKAIDLVDQLLTKFSNQEYLIKPEDVDNLITEKTKVPVGKILQDEEIKLKNIDTELAKRVIGQTQAIKAVASALRRSRLQIGTDKKPIGSFLFLGPTGVGKTETAKALASHYFSDEKRLIRFDMSQYQQGSSIDELLGLLVEKVKNNPFSVLLLDELEKADKNILNIFLTIFDEGYVTDPRGKKISFCDLVIIATSNAASEFIRQEVNQGTSQDNLNKVVIEYIQRQGIFAPEFLNRFDAVVVFRPLTQKELGQIAHLQLKDLTARLSQKDIILEITPDLIQSVSQKGFSPEFGARPMKRWISDTVEDEIAKLLLSGVLVRGAKIALKWDEAQNKYLIAKL